MEILVNSGIECNSVVTMRKKVSSGNGILTFMENQSRSSPRTTDAIKLENVQISKIILSTCAECSKNCAYRMRESSAKSVSHF